MAEKDRRLPDTIKSYRTLLEEECAEGAVRDCLGQEGWLRGISYRRGPGGLHRVASIGRRKFYLSYYWDISFHFKDSKLEAIRAHTDFDQNHPHYQARNMAWLTEEIERGLRFPETDHEVGCLCWRGETVEALVSKMGQWGELHLTLKRLDFR